MNFHCAFPPCISTVHFHRAFPLCISTVHFHCAFIVMFTKNPTLTGREGERARMSSAARLSKPRSRDPSVQHQKNQSQKTRVESQGLSRDSSPLSRTHKLSRSLPRMIAWKSRISKTESNPAVLVSGHRGCPERRQREAPTPASRQATRRRHTQHGRIP